jgi:hypothetical protein
MFGKKIHIAVLIMLALFISGICLAADPVPVASPAASVAPGVIVLEIETFTIVNGKVVDHPEASAGKAVLSTSYEFKATKNYNFDKLGFWEITIFENAPDGGKDAINLGVGDSGDLRTYPNEATDMGKFRPCIKKYLFEVKKVGEQEIRIFTSNEMGSLYDKLEIKFVKAP